MCANPIKTALSYPVHPVRDFISRKGAKAAEEQVRNGFRGRPALLTNGDASSGLVAAMADYGFASVILSSTGLRTFQALSATISWPAAVG
jgi:hypothetical protein